MSENTTRASMPTLLRTYSVEENQIPDCSILEAACATCATPGLFKSFNIDEPGGLGMGYFDGGLGNNNPAERLLVEANQVFPDQYVASVVSIGAGQAHTIKLPERTTLHRILPIKPTEAVIAMTKDCERTSEAMEARFKPAPGVYFRLNVDQGTQAIGASDWEKISEAVSHARAYLSLVETGKRVDHAVKALEAQKPVVSTRHLSTSLVASIYIIAKTEAASVAAGEIHIAESRKYVVKECPPPSPIFIGQVKALAGIERCLLGSPSGQCVFVIHGLGGSGKTQIALKFVDLHKSRCVSGFKAALM
jgi:hypothetical protein